MKRQLTPTVWYELFKQATIRGKESIWDIMYSSYQLNNMKPKNIIVIENFSFGEGPVMSGKMSNGNAPKVQIQKGSIFEYIQPLDRKPYWAYDIMEKTVTSGSNKIRVGACFIRNEKDFDEYKDFLRFEE